MPDTVVSVKLWPFGAIPISRNKGLALGYWIDIIIWVENSHPRAKANVPCPYSATGIVPNVASEELFLLQKCNCMAMSCCCPLNRVTSNRIKSWTGENHLNSDYDILVRSLKHRPLKVGLTEVLHHECHQYHRFHR